MAPYYVGNDRTRLFFPSLFLHGPLLQERQGPTLSTLKGESGVLSALHIRELALGICLVFPSVPGTQHHVTHRDMRSLI